MNMIRKSIWVNAFIAACILCLPALADDPVYFGYVEGDYAYLAPRLSGTVAKVMVADGQQVVAGTPLFAMDSQRQRLALDAAQARLAVAQANWQDKSTGMRPEEIAIIEERLSSAEASLALATATLKRTAELRKRQTVPASQYDQDRAAQLNAEASVHQLKAERNAARLPAREAQLEAAHQTILAAQTEVTQAELDLHDQTATAPEAGRVERVFLQVGEFAAAGTPIVSLLPPSRPNTRHRSARTDQSF